MDGGFDVQTAVWNMYKIRRFCFWRRLGKGRRLEMGMWL
jgi:hypothetical protein